MTAYPLVLDLTDRKVVVVGGGYAAAQRAASYVDAGADVVVVAPWVCDPLADLAADGSVTLRRRVYEPGDLDDAWLAHASTGDQVLDHAVLARAEKLRVWCVRDDAPTGSASLPSVARAGSVVVAVGTDDGTTDPPRARRVRDAVALALDTGRLPRRRRRAGSGSVSLVGGGPGDPQLVTVRARSHLAEADVVVVDRLAPRAVLDELDHDVLVIDVGKSPDSHPVPQDEINRLLVSHARRGRRVVRLKGGDPYVLGRGGEELLYCRAAGVEVHVVPGVTSAFAVPAAAGIPVTHRGLSRQVTVLSGHEDADWAALARAGGTLVFLMGVATLPSIAGGLLAHGMDPSTPVAIVERGWLPDHRTTTGPLHRITEVAARLRPRSPAVVVVGAVVGVAQVLGEDASLAPVDGAEATRTTAGPTPYSKALTHAAG
jgi:uroporphyrin-III C-methyltransferase / precorrin-2 dehydrogenase / sirohydrochlorin ferrochelatase